ncbi:Trp biosynthesis-associated membrane protein [Tomitella cavernea]|uniref:TIGR02234 family membrane protein n=1 Tax=Tomitella cavernea TaxID=1387982 RepID=A0ABP9CYL1_9ACTN
MSGGAEAAARRGDARRMAVVAGLLALGALATWAAGRMDWVGYTYENGLQPPVDGSFDGAAWASELTPLALVLLAGIAAMFAVRGWAQRVIGLIVAAAGATIVVRSAMALTSAADPAEVVRLGELRAGAVVTAAQTHPGPIVLAIVGGVLAAAAGLLMVLRPRPRRELPSKYETPAARRDSVAKAMAARRGRTAGTAGGGAAGAAADDDLTQRLMWEALDSGADPTEDDDPAVGDGRADG